MDFNWLWLVGGFIPYYIKRHQTKDEQLLAVKALFWQLTIRWKEEQCSWDISIPFIEHLRR